MSKWQLPTQKGTELFPQATRNPTKVRFEGVPVGSTLAQELYRAFAPQISHFHRSQAQNYSLSTIENYHTHRAYFGGALRMIYANLQGQEIITIKVAGELVRQVLEEKKEQLWDFALVEIVVPEHNETLGGPIWSYARHGSTVAGDFGNPNAYEDGFIAFPDPATPGTYETVDTDTDIGRSSVRFDLRGFSRFLTVDLHSLVPGPIELQQINTTDPYGLGELPDSITDTGETTLAVGIHQTPGPGGDYYDGVWSYTPDPAVYWPPGRDEFGQLAPYKDNFTYDAYNHVTSYDAHVAEQHNLDDDGGSGFFWDLVDDHSTEYYVPEPIYGDVEQSVSRECEVRVTFFMTRNDWMPHEIVNGAIVHHQWELSSMYPARPVGQLIGSVTLVNGYVNDPEFGSVPPLVGKVTFDRLIGAASWKAI